MQKKCTLVVVFEMDIWGLKTIGSEANHIFRKTILSVLGLALFTLLLTFTCSHFYGFFENKIMYRHLHVGVALPIFHQCFYSPCTSLNTLCIKIFLVALGSGKGFFFSAFPVTVNDQKSVLKAQAWCARGRR